MQNFYKNIVILGGGTAGWMTAAALSRVAPRPHFSVTLVESEQIGTVGVGEATIPHIREFNYMLGIKEHEFMQAVSATYKLGIRFQGWGNENSDYYHPFGAHGFDINNIAFHHYWLRTHLNEKINVFDDFSFAIVAAKKERFAPPDPDQNKINSSYSYAYHLDAIAYAAFLRSYAEQKGIKRVEGKVTQIDQDQSSGDITRLTLENGVIIEGDLFVDCSGFSALLLGEKLNVTYEDWSQWLPCDSAYAVQSELVGAPVPYTVSTARKAGWQWRIPLQRRMGNGYVYCSKFTDNEKARATLTKNIEGQLISEPRKFNFTTGMRTHSWVKNCVAIGLSSGFLEPLESTSIYLIQLGIYKLLELLPAGEIQDIEREEYNREIKLEYERVRDFLILHYKLNNRQGSEFWDYCKNMDIPDSLEYKISLFKKSAHVFSYKKGLFSQPTSWLSVYFGQGLVPDIQHPLLASIDQKTISEKLTSILELLSEETNKLPKHVDVLLQPSKNISGQSRPSFSLYGESR